MAQDAESSQERAFSELHHGLMTVRGAPGRSLWTQFQMLLVRGLLILPLRAVGPVACVYWAQRILSLLSGRKRGPRRARSRWFLVCKEMIKMWFSVEACFYLYYLVKRQQFQAQEAKPPQIPHGQVLPILRRMFQATEDIQLWGKTIEPQSRRSAICTPQLSRQSSGTDLPQLLASPNLESDVEALLRQWDSLQQEAVALGPNAGADNSPLRRIATERMLNDAEMLALKHAEVSGWFVRRSTGACERWPAVRLGEICRGNIEEFLAWAFFHCTPDRLPPDRKKEFEEVFREGARWVGLQFPAGYNPDAQPMRLTMDRIVSEHRPFAWYATTALVLPFLTSQLLTRLGFKQYKSGTLSYWHCVAPADPAPSGMDFPEDDFDIRVPIVFVHGLGVNLLPYYWYIKELLQIAAGRPILLVSLPHISMRWQEHVPSSAEMVACLSDMLASWGFTSAHFMGHSFGSLPLAWMVRQAPHLVSMVTFIDPVCFLIIKPDVCYNFIYKKPSSPMELLSNFLVAKELFIAYSLSRNFFWFMNLLWPEDVTMPAVVALCGKDNIVPAHSIRRYLAVYKQRTGLDSLKVLWFPDHAHGECVAPSRQASTRCILEEALLIESAYASKCGKPGLGGRGVSLNGKSCGMPSFATDDGS